MKNIKKAISVITMIVFLTGLVPVMSYETKAAGNMNIVLIGDSRTCGIQGTVNGRFKNPLSMTDSQGRSWFAKVGAGYDWMVSTAVPQAESKIGAGTAVVILMGVNDIGGEYMPEKYGKKYYTYLNQKAAEWAARGATTYFVAVGPVGRGSKYVKNTYVNAFNDMMRTNLRGIVYLDPKGQVSFSTNSSGVHYTGETNKAWYEFIVSHLMDYSRVYDYEYYINKYPDLWKAFGNCPEKAFAHFVYYGMKEGRQARADFDMQSYKNRYGDLVRAYGSDRRAYYWHYMRYGAAEGRNAAPVSVKRPAAYMYYGTDYRKVYDYTYYINVNPDVRRVYGGNDVAALRHFAVYGMREGRRAKESFDVRRFRSARPDLADTFGNNWNMYFQYYMDQG